MPLCLQAMDTVMVTKRANKSFNEFVKVHQTEVENDSEKDAKWKGVAGCVKVNFDEVVDKEKGHVGLGCIARTERGEFRWAARVGILANWAPE